MSTTIGVSIDTIIDARPDGSFIYMSHKGVLNLDDYRELVEEQKETKSFIISARFPSLA
jgi:hypothetical protein